MKIFNTNPLTLISLIPVFLLISLFNFSGCKKNDQVNTCYDISDHKVSFITTEPDVKLEVLDWGGKGEYLVLLTGLGDNAHVFDNFAYQFTDLFHVIGITRRGFGKSSKPADGYSEEIRVRDYISILDQLNISKASFIGHSIACGELSYLGSHYQDRINKLVYLDGLDYGEHKFLKQPPGPDFTDADIVSLEHFIAVNVRYSGFREPNAAYCDTYSMDAEGKITGTISPPEVTAKLVASNVTTDYSLITAPVLGIFEVWTLETRYAFYDALDSEKKSEYDSTWPILFDWRVKQLTRFRTGIKNCRVIELEKFYHYVYLTKEMETAKIVREFLTEK